MPCACGYSKPNVRPRPRLGEAVEQRPPQTRAARVVKVQGTLFGLIRGSDPERTRRK